MISSLKPYPAYKDSGLPWLGQVPGHWEVRRLKTVLRETERRSTEGEGTLLSLTRVRGLIPHREMTDRMHSAKTLVGYKCYRAGQLVMNRMQAWSGMFGAGPTEGLVSPDYAVFDVIGDHSVKFLLERLKAPDFVGQFALESKGIGSGFNRLYTDRFGPIPIPLPPPSEQAAIVRFLDWANGRLERAIRAKRKIITLLNEQKQAIIHQAVTRGLDPSVRLKPSGIPWLGDIPEHWEVRRLRASITDCVNGLWGADPDGENDLTCVRVADFDRSNLRVTLKRKTIRAIPVSGRVRRLLQPGDLLLEKSGGGERQPVGAVVLYDSDEPAVCSNFVARMPVAPGYHAGFLNYLHSTLYALRMTVPSIKQTTGIQNLDGKSYLAERVAFPDLSEQVAISSLLDNESERFSQAISRLEREIALLREYRTRLVADVVTGKLDVREAAARLPDEGSIGGNEGDVDLEDESEALDEEALP